MKIVVLGAGAIGSLFGGLLSKKNDVTLVSRKTHVQTIKKNGLKITGKTKLKVNIVALDSISKIGFSPDLLILTVKSYDTEAAIKEAKSIIANKTVVLFLQNGLDNIEKICKTVDERNVVAGITTHGVFFSKPGVVKHTGIGETILGELNGKKTERIKQISDIFRSSGIETKISTDIFREIWIKAVVNSSINPLTTFFQCKNGYLLKNPILERIVEKICEESTRIANSAGIYISYDDTIKKTKEVVRITSENYSSMLQSIKKDGRTEIESINGKLVGLGKKNNVETLLNEALIYSIDLLNK